MNRNVLFVVNPNAGKKISEKIIRTIEQFFPADINYLIVVWKDRNHFTEILRAIQNDGYTDVVAVGGDGTVNQIAKSIAGTPIRLGIVPVGSGNGLARSLGLSMHIEKAIQQIAAGKSIAIDYGTVNATPFFCTSGVGFDAHIGNLFATSAKRGLKNYVRISLSEYRRYKAKDYTIHINGQTLRRKAFLITVANAGQYGNDFYIAPQASMQDGLFHVVILQPVNIVSAIGLVAKTLRKKAHTSALVETFTASELIIERDQNDTIHFDGEPAMELPRVQYKIVPQALQAIIGDKWSKS